MTLTQYLLPLAGYLIGSIPFSYLVTFLFTGEDIREIGSKNVGATNVLRTSGKAAGFLALLLDTAKGSASVLLGHFVTGSDMWGAITGFSAVVGHSFPVFLKFRGGKSVATGAGAFLVFSPLAILSSIVVFAGLLKFSRIVSLSSMIASSTFPLFAWIYGANNAIVFWGAMSAGWIVVRHHENIVRLFQGTETRMGDPKG